MLTRPALPSLRWSVADLLHGDYQQPRYSNVIPLQERRITQTSPTVTCQIGARDTMAI